MLDKNKVLKNKAWLQDILTFLVFFVTIYMSFVVTTYSLYSEATRVTNSSPFVDIPSTFKFYFWAMIKTGNPDYASLESPPRGKISLFSTGCLRNALALQGVKGDWVPNEVVSHCYDNSSATGEDSFNAD